MLHKRYQLSHDAQRSGSSTVRTAICKKSGTKVAVKTLNKSNHSHKAIVEVAAMVRLMPSPYVLGLLDIIPGHDETHIITQYYPYGTLQDSFQGCMSEADVKVIVKRAVNMLNLCHDHGIVHNDIKPNNLLFRSKDDLDSLVLIDFGEAMLDGYQQLILRGTPHYMSRERLYMDAGPKSDIWSVGIMIHYLLTGMYPHDDVHSPHSPNINNVFKSILYQQPYIHSVKISKECNDLLEHILQPDVNKRASASDILSHKWFLV